MTLDHVALLTPDLAPGLDLAARLGVHAHPVEEFPGEGTREVYLGTEAPRLLLLQPLGDAGPYSLALAKRGPGLHHLAIQVESIAAFLEGDLGGWLLHPRSVATITQSDTAWLCRPGAPTLVEVQGGSRGGASGAGDAQPTVELVEVPLEAAPEPLLRIFAGLVTRSPDAVARITVAGTRETIAGWCGGAPNTGRPS